MSTIENIGKSLDEQFENHNYLPQKLELEDIGMGFKKFVEDQNFSLLMENGIMKTVPVIYMAQELWAERKMNWNNMRNENGEELTKPYIALYRNSVKKGSSPFKYSIPNRKRFSFIKVPVFDGTLKGYEIYKVPQPTHIDIEYELKFFTHYAEDVDKFYELVLNNMYASGQGYMKINGYFIASKINGDPSEDSTMDDITSERNYQISVPITVHGKIIDSSEFEKVNTINKVNIKISLK